MIRHLTSVTRRGANCCFIRNNIFSDTTKTQFASLQECRSNIVFQRHHSASTERTSNIRTNELDNELFQKRYTTIRSCYDLWLDVPKAGLFFEVEYYDSSPDMAIDPEVPLVLALPDTPGTADGLLPVLNLLAKLGYRVIAPNFPGYGKTKWVKWRDWNVFTGALDERMHFIFDFNTSLDIRRVDVLLGYGLGCSTCVALSGTDSNIFRSVVLLCPAEHTPLKPVKGKLRFQNAEKLFSFWESLQLRPFVWVYMIFNKGTYGYSGYPTMQVINAARAIAGSGYKVLQSFMTRLQNKGVPCCVVYHSVADAKVPPEISQMYAESLGIKPEDFVTYYGDKKSNQDKIDFPKGLKIEHETPALLETYAKPIARMIRGVVKTLGF